MSEPKAKNPGAIVDDPEIKSLHAILKELAKYKDEPDVIERILDYCNRKHPPASIRDDE